MAGRVFGAAGTIGDISIPIAMLVYGFLLKLTTLSVLAAVTGALLIVLSVIFYIQYRHIDVFEQLLTSKNDRSDRKGTPVINGRRRMTN